MHDRRAGAVKGRKDACFQSLSNNALTICRRTTTKIHRTRDAFGYAMSLYILKTHR
jgi:hypothetical protein